MPKIRTSRSKKPPAGFENIEDTLLDFDTKLKDGKPKNRQHFKSNIINFIQFRY